MIWFLTRIAVPLLFAIGIVVTRWGSDNVVLYIAVPPVLLVVRIATGDSQDTIDARSKVRDWYRGHFYEILALVFLGAFQVAVAAMAEGKVANVGYWLIMVLMLFMPYLFLMLVSSYSLQPVDTDPDS
ncbi:MAG: hypothetical protein K8T91_16045 [Planctomycetes bacterium]|nr:hypothetical protein [Planctomycetota bacterium]